MPRRGKQKATRMSKTISQCLAAIDVDPSGESETPPLHHPSLAPAGAHHTIPPPPPTALLLLELDAASKLEEEFSIMKKRYFRKVRCMMPIGGDRQLGGRGRGAWW